MAQQGSDSLEVRDFVSKAKRELAFEVPDEEAFKKAAKASGKFKMSKKS
jgi:acyl carrier protein